LPTSCITSMSELLDRCPACRARLAKAAVCPRCGCDFSLVRQAIGQAARLLEQALCSLAIGDRVAARRQVGASLALHRWRLAEAIRSFLDTAADTDPTASGPAQPPGLLAADLQGASDPTSIREEDAYLPA